MGGWPNTLVDHWHRSRADCPVVLYLVWPVLTRRGPNHYMWRAQLRLQFANGIWAGLQQQAAAGTLEYEKVKAAEAQLHKLWLSQRGETTPAYEALSGHREQYATLIEFLYRKVKDIRATGGQNLARIDAELDAYGAYAMERRRQSQRDKEELLR